MKLILTRVLENDVDIDHLIVLQEKEIERQNFPNFVHDLLAMQRE